MPRLLQLDGAPLTLNRGKAQELTERLVKPGRAEGTSARDRGMVFALAGHLRHANTPLRLNEERAAFLARYEATRREVAAMQAALEYIGLVRMPPGYRFDAITDYRDLPDNGVTAWRSAIAALATDASASLPIDPHCS